MDGKFLKKYGVAVSKFAPYRRKKGGRANIQDLRHGRFYVLLATHGRHDFFDEEPFKHCREEPIKFASYSVGFRAQTQAQQFVTHIQEMLNRGSKRKDQTLNPLPDEDVVLRIANG